MIDKLKHKSGLLRQSCFCLIFFFAVFAFSSAFASAAAELEYSAANAVNNSHIAAFPSGDVDTEAAVRWNYRCRTNSALRLDNRNNYRSVSGVQNNSAELQSIPSCYSLAANSCLWHNQPSLTYYRRLWQKILPSRAGPCV